MHSTVPCFPMQAKYSKSGNDVIVAKFSIMIGLRELCCLLVHDYNNLFFILHVHNLLQVHVL